MRLLAFALVAIVLAGCATPTPEAPAWGPTGGGPEWSFAAIDGSTQTRDMPASNATILFFMATWCGSCRAKAPVLSEVTKEYGVKGVRTLSLDFDPTETEADLLAWQEHYDQPWPHGIDEGLRMQRLFGVTSQSSVVVLDGEGNVAKLFDYGQVSASGLRAALDAALAA
jgi:thiol-disulfide isomerase/thioredoxin